MVGPQHKADQQLAAGGDGTHLRETMGTAANVPFELRAIGAGEVGSLLGLAARTVLETVACRPDFPVRISMRPATWIAGEVLKWREANRAGQRARRRRSGSRSKDSSNPDDL